MKTMEIGGGVYSMEVRYVGLIFCLRTLKERLIAHMAYVKFGSNEEATLEWFPQDVFPYNTDDDLMPMEIIYSERMSTSDLNLDSEKASNYSTRRELMFPVLPVRRKCE